MNNAIRNTLLAVIALAVVSLSARNFSGAATTTSTAPARHYYLTKAAFDGNQALTACVSGYHFASFAELADPGVLTYNKTLGRSQADDGQGPPQNIFGWARTGYASSSTSPGGEPLTNCNVWTSGASTDNGTAGSFTFPYWNPASQGYGWVPVFASEQGPCDAGSAGNVGVWCVEN